MLKQILAVAIIMAASVLPAKADVISNLTINNVSIGSYGQPEGVLVVNCTNGFRYIVLLGPEWAKGAITAALTAQATGRTINVNTTTPGPLAKDFFIDRIESNAQ